ncbi:hypothetical protein K8Q94_00645 [Candidatus Nomurabacteria bacterium]|nr:hypothetical protein [Candidatus Nomurabacteria bacterium]
MRKFLIIVSLLLASLFSVALAQENSNPSAGTSASSRKLFAPVFSTGVSVHRGLTLGGGVRIRDTEKLPPMRVEGTFSLPKTSFGLSYRIYPFKNPKWIGFGVEGLYFYKTNFSFYSELFFGGNGAQTFKDLNTYWCAKRLVLSPFVDIFIPIGKCRLGSTINPFLFGFWDRVDGRYGIWKRWTNIGIYFSMRLASKQKS